MRVSQIMTKDITCGEAYTLLDDVIRLMKARDLGFLPIVTEEGSSRTLIGVLTDRDLVVRTNGRDSHSLTAADCMTTSVISCGASDTVEWALELMAKYQVRRLPVTAHGHLEGIITLGDIVRCDVVPARTLCYKLRRIYSPDKGAYRMRRAVSVMGAGAA
jgi:CBS-domain-containing membrane protein